VRVNSREIGDGVLESCRRGDRDAFRALYEAYRDRVYSIALYFHHGDESAAADVTQQVFMKLLTDITRFQGRSSFSTWLYRIVVNVCIDGQRRSKANRQTADPEVLDRLPDPVSHEERFASAEDRRAVQSAVASLPATYRLAILLRYFDDLSYEEIGAALNCSVGTVASRLSRGHRLLARDLARLRRNTGVEP